jgi:Holliday junction resolvase RusA-like endonuclease
MISIFIPTKPVSASRPRVTSFGSYYSKSYMAYRKETHQFLKKIAKEHPIDEKAQFCVNVEFICYKPKKPTNSYPRYDIDNLAKAVLDAITHAKMIWKDDIQIVELNCTKRYQKDGEDFGTNIEVIKCKNSD